MGAVTPAGLTMNETWESILTGRVNAGTIRAFDATEFPCKIAYEVSDKFELNTSLIKRQHKKMLNRAFGFGVNAATEALQSSGLLARDRSVQERARTGVCLGVGMISPDYAWYERTVLKEKYDLEEIQHHYRYLPHTLTTIVSDMAAAEGGNTTVHTACASSGQSLGEAWHLIASGEQDVMITGGADSMINPFHLAGFCLLGTLSKRNDDPATASRPFDAERDGFVLGEGACVLVFEELQHALNRGAKILAEVCGYGCTESAYRITDLEPEGNGPLQAMQGAVDAAGIDAGKVGYINAHGTSTALNDVCESIAIKKVFGNAPYVSSSKSVTGHLISAAGAIEFATCVNSVANGVVPPSTNIFNQDGNCVVKLAERQPLKTSLDYALSNSVGFGGSNTAIIAGRIS
jgi:3-oxoacyl-[acyl-carrier-protein] synthase II